MKELNNLILLYDYYKDLLTDIQRSYFEKYYFDNLSLAEIADEYNISRNAVHKQIKSASEKLYFYEKKLKIIKKTNDLLNEANKISNIELKEKIIKIIES